MERDVYHFLDCNYALAIGDGNAFIANQLYSQEVDGLSDAEKHHLYANGGFPRIGFGTKSFLDLDKTQDLRYPDGISFVLSRDNTRNSRQRDVIMNNTYLDLASYIYAKCKDGVNGCVIDANGDVNQENRTIDEICKDRLFYTYDSVILKRGFQFSGFSQHNNVGTYLLPFLDKATGKGISIPSSQWTQHPSIPAGYSSSTENCIGLTIDIHATNVYNGTVNRPTRHPSIHEGLWLESGDFVSLSGSQNFLQVNVRGSNAQTWLSSNINNSFLEILVHKGQFVYRFNNNNESNMILTSLHFDKTSIQHVIPSVDFGFGVGKVNYVDSNFGYAINYFTDFYGNPVLQ